MNASSDPPTVLHGAARSRAMLAIALSVLITTLDYSVANIALPTIGADLHARAADSIWVVNAYQLASLIGLLPLASLGELTGRDRMCRIGLVVFVAASLCCALSGTLLQLTLSRVLQGLGGACIMSVNAALVRAIYPGALLGRGMSLNGLVVALGVALGPTVAAGVLSVASWRWIFLLNLPFGLIALLAARSLPRSSRPAAADAATQDQGSLRQRLGAFDGASALLTALAFGPLVVGLDRLAHRGTPGLSLLLIGVGLLCLVWLVRRQLGSVSPMLPVDLLALRAFRTAFFVGVSGFVASNFFIVTMPFLFEQQLHRTAVQTGLLITPWPISIVVVSALVARIADRYPAGLLSSLGLGVTGLGFVLLWRMPAQPSDLDVIWRIALAGSGFALFQPPNNRTLLVAAPASRSGSASAMVSVARLLGQTIGAMLVALVFTLLAAAAARRCLMLGAMVAFAAALLSASRLWQRAAARNPAGP